MDTETITFEEWFDLIEKEKFVSNNLSDVEIIELMNHWFDLEEEKKPITRESLLKEIEETNRQKEEIIREQKQIRYEVRGGKENKVLKGLHDGEEPEGVHVVSGSYVGFPISSDRLTKLVKKYEIDYTKNIEEPKRYENTRLMNFLLWIASLFGYKQKGRW